LGSNQRELKWVEAAPDGIDILPPDSVQLAHTLPCIDQNIDDITRILREYLEQGGDNFARERFRNILFFLAGLRDRAGLSAM